MPPSVVNHYRSRLRRCVKVLPALASTDPAFRVGTTQLRFPPVRTIPSVGWLNVEHQDGVAVKLEMLDSDQDGLRLVESENG